jgi:NAD(P)H-dependent FMN reductase
MPRIVAISGSLRRGSYNTALLRAAVELAPAGLEMEVAAIHELPLYDADVEAQGLPAAVSALKEKIAASDGLLLASPEYNHGVPGVLKNAIDWLSRPARDIPRVFGGRAAAIMGASGGGGGTRLAQAAWLPTLRALMLVPWFGKQLFVANAKTIFDEQGKLTDEATRKHLGDFMAGFAAFVAAHRRAG